MDDNQDDELVGEEEETKNWKGGILSFIVVILVFLMVLIAIVVNRPAVIISNKTKLTLDNLIENFEPKRFDGNWISHNKFAYLSEDLNIKVFSCDGLNSTTIVSNHTIIPMIGDKFQFHVSTEPNILLFEYNRVEINRHSFTAQYKLYNTMNNMVFDVMSANSFENVPLQNVQLSPDGHKVAFVDKNDIHLMDKFFEGQKDAIQITDDGVENTVYNGIADWVYEEEILQATNAMYWSPNSRFLAYIKFNDSNVDLFTLSIYEDLPHSHLYNIRYPKAGMVNPTVEVIVHDTEKNQAIKQTVPNSVKQGFVEYYIFNVKFFSDSELIVVYVNREQKKSITVITDVLTGNVNFEKEYPTQDSSAWDIPIDLDVSKSHDLYFQIWSIDNYANILAFNSKNGNIQQVTTHQFDVTEIVYVHEVSSEVFYIGTNNDPKQRHLYKKKISRIQNQNRNA